MDPAKRLAMGWESLRLHIEFKYTVSKLNTGKCDLMSRILLITSSYILFRISNTWRYDYKNLYYIYIFI